MKFFYLFCFAALTSCAGEKECSTADASVNSKNRVEICHNPQSDTHRKVCDHRCFEPNLGQNSFCWTLSQEDCTPPHIYQWQQENCHFFD